MSEILLAPHVDAVLDRLGELDGITIGDHVAPRSPDDLLVVPAAVVYMRPGGAITGSIGCLDTDGILPFQVTCIGETAAQARWVADLVHAALTADPLEIDDRYVARLHRNFLGASAQRDDDVKPPVFYLPAEYRLMTNAAEPIGS